VFNSALAQRAQFVNEAADNGIPQKAKRLYNHQNDRRIYSVPEKSDLQCENNGAFPGIKIYKMERFIGEAGGEEIFQSRSRRTHTNLHLS
jgi:hypothetical protein